MKEKDNNAEARFAAFRDYFERGFKEGRIRSKADFARQLGCAPNTIFVAFRTKSVSRSLFLRLQGVASGFASRWSEGFIQIPVAEYEQMRKTIANLSVTIESQARIIERLTTAESVVE